MSNIVIYIIAAIILLQVESFRSNPFLHRQRSFLVHTFPTSPLQETTRRRPGPVQASFENDCISDTHALRKESITKLINTLLLNTSLSAKQIVWGKDKLDVTLVNTMNGTEVSPNLDEIDSFHRSLHKGVESDARLADALETLDITVGSPGLGDVLQTDRDFETFKVSWVRHFIPSCYL